jgi:hypothetical protein
VNCKGFGRKRSWTKFRYYLNIRLEGLGKTTKTLNQDSRSPERIFEAGTRRIRSKIVNHSTMTFGCTIGGSNIGALENISLFVLLLPYLFSSANR